MKRKIVIYPLDGTPFMVEFSDKLTVQYNSSMAEDSPGVDVRIFTSGNRDYDRSADDKFYYSGVRMFYEPSEITMYGLEEEKE